MDFKAYLTLLKPLFKRTGVATALDNTMDEINNTLMPHYTTIASILMTGKSDLYKLADLNLRKQISGVRAGSWVEVVKLALSNINLLIPEIQKRINKELDSDIAASGLSFREANLVRTVESFNFYVGYARTLLRAVVVVETRSGPLKDFFSKADIEWIMGGMTGFSLATQMLVQPVQKTLQRLDDIPDVLVDEEGGVGVGLYSSGNIDPLGMSNWQATDRWSYRARMWFLQREEDRLQAAKEEAQALEYHIIALKQKQADGTENAATEKQIEYHEHRLMTLRNKIKAQEEKDA